MPRGGSIVASLKLKGIDGLAPQAVDFAVQLDWAGIGRGSEYNTGMFLTHWLGIFGAPAFFFTMGIGMALFSLGRRDRRGWTALQLCAYFLQRCGILFLVDRVANICFDANRLVALAKGDPVRFRGVLLTPTETWLSVFLGTYQVMTCLGLTIFLMATCVIPLLLAVDARWPRFRASTSHLRALPEWLPTPMTVVGGAVGAALFALSNVLIIAAQDGNPALSTPFPRSGAVPSGFWQYVARFLFYNGTLSKWGTTSYTVVPWAGFAVFGFVAGPQFADNPRRAHRRCLAAAFVCLFLFAGVRLVGGPVGNYRGHYRGEEVTGLARWMDFLNVCKYPPSPAGALLTISLSLFLIWFDSLVELEETLAAQPWYRTVAIAGLEVRPPIAPLIFYPVLWWGRAPLFFYVAHAVMLGGVNVVLRAAIRPGLPWAGCVLVWLAVLLLLIPMCFYYGRFKAGKPPDSLWRLL